jgi:hypothetical protein
MTNHTTGYIYNVYYGLVATAGAAVGLLFAGNVYSANMIFGNGQYRAYTGTFVATDMTELLYVYISADSVVGATVMSLDHFRIELPDCAI